jgi:hypothetical protein
MVVMLVAKNPSIPLVPNFPRGEENNGSERSPVRRRRAGQEAPPILKRHRMPCVEVKKI